MNVWWVFVFSFVLILLGVGLVASVTYQEVIEEEPDFHMGIVTKRYVWRSHNSLISLVGGVLISIGLIILFIEFFVVFLFD